MECCLSSLTSNIVSSGSKANAIIAYNNRPATEAVPYFEQVINIFA